MLNIYTIIFNEGTMLFARVSYRIMRKGGENHLAPSTYQETVPITKQLEYTFGKTFFLQCCSYRTRRGIQSCKQLIYSVVISDTTNTFLTMPQLSCFDFHSKMILQWLF